MSEILYTITSVRLKLVNLDQFESYFSKKYELRGSKLTYLKSERNPGGGEILTG